MSRKGNTAIEGWSAVVAATALPGSCKLLTRRISLAADTFGRGFQRPRHGDGDRKPQDRKHDDQGQRPAGQPQRLKGQIGDLQ